MNSTSQHVIAILYGKFNFVAESPDEVSFRQGERIRLLERDELFNDGIQSFLLLVFEIKSLSFRFISQFC